MSVLDGVKTALITGASGGIGEAFARQLAAQGKDLVLVARSEDKLNALARELASSTQCKRTSSPPTWPSTTVPAALYAETERLGWRWICWSTMPALAREGEFTELSFEVQADMVRLNVNTLMELTRLYLPAMRQRQRGGVINVGSTASFQPVPYMAVYGATKAFVLSFSEALAEEVAADGVTVMALCPGATATGFQATAGVWEEQRYSMPAPTRSWRRGCAPLSGAGVRSCMERANKLTAIAARFSPGACRSHDGRFVNSHR